MLDVILSSTTPLRKLPPIEISRLLATPMKIVASPSSPVEICARFLKNAFLALKTPKPHQEIN